MYIDSADIHKVLCEVITNQHRKLQWDKHYIRHLLGQLSWEEFKHLSKEYCVPIPPVTDIKKLTSKIETLLYNTHIKCTSADLVDIFTCAHEDAEKALATAVYHLLVWQKCRYWAGLCIIALTVAVFGGLLGIGLANFIF